MVNANKSPKARVLGGMLREARIAADLGLRQFALSIGRDPGMVSRWETGDRTPKPTEVAQILTKLGITGRRFDEIVTFAEHANEPHWLAMAPLEDLQQLTALVDFERAASAITTCSLLLVPGLLQVNGYIEGIMYGGGLTQDQIDARIAKRIDRREPLFRDQPVQLRSFVGEAAIRQLIGNRAVMVDQLRYLLGVRERPNIEIRVVPADVGWHPGLDGPFQLIESVEAGPIVHVETRASALYLHGPKEIRTYRDAVDLIERKALGAAESALFIAAELHRLQGVGGALRTG